MPFFPDQALLFLHIPKNAGRSVEDAFLPSHDNADWGRPNWVNCAARLMLDMSRSDFAHRHVVGTQDIAVAAQHLTYAEMELLGLLPEEKPRATFAICRNPYDRAVSSVTHFKGKQDDAASFEQALSEWLDAPLTDHNLRAHRRTQRAFVVDTHNRPVTSHVLRFEKLQADFDAFVQELGLADRTLPWRGKASRARDLGALFTPASKAMVEREFGEDLEHFGYSFG